MPAVRSQGSSPLSLSPRTICSQRSSAHTCAYDPDVPKMSIWLCDGAPRPVRASIGLGVIRALFYPRAQRSPGARRGPRPWATPCGEAAWAYVVDVGDGEHQPVIPYEVRARVLCYGQIDMLVGDRPLLATIIVSLAHSAF